jgi:hypothetical protein
MAGGMVSDRALVSRAYVITAMAGASAGIDRFVLEGLLGHGTGPLITSMVDQGQLVEVGDGTRLLAGRSPVGQPARRESRSLRSSTRRPRNQS